MHSNNTQPPSYAQVMGIDSKGVSQNPTQENHQASCLGEPPHNCPGCQCAQQSRQEEEVIEFSIEEQLPRPSKTCFVISSIALVVAILVLVGILINYIRWDQGTHSWPRRGPGPSWKTRGWPGRGEHSG